jgi:hypothetical protein
VARGDDDLAVEVQSLATGRQEPDRTGRRQGVVEEVGDRIEHVLAVVHDDDAVEARQRIGHGASDHRPGGDRDPESLREGGREVVVVPDGSQIDPCDLCPPGARRPSPGGSCPRHRVRPA